jgi:hypothetical protein
MMDAKIAAIYKDSIDVPLASVKKGDEATAVSYAEAFKNLEAKQNEKAEALMNRFPNPAPIDEIYLKRKDIAKPEEQPKATEPNQKMSAKDFLNIAGISVAALIVVLLLLPSLIYAYYKLRYKNAKAEGNKAYWAYRTAGFYLHQVGITRGNRTPMQYARETVDPTLGTAFVSFMNIYLKKKYAQQPLSPQEQQYVTGFLKPFLKTVRRKLPFKQRALGFLNPSRSLGFFVRPEDDGTVLD